MENLTDMIELEDQIMELSVQTGGRLKFLATSNNTILTKTIVDEDTMNRDFIELDKIPDIVRNIPQYDGNPLKLANWIADVDETIESFSKYKATNQYKVILITIKRKIIGKAQNALQTTNHLSTWKEIKDSLILHCGDKRSLMTLNKQLNKLTRKNETIETFYAKVQEMQLFIANRVNLDNKYKGGEKFIIKLYADIALQTFLRGIRFPMSQYMMIHRPNNLVQAYKYVLKFKNMEITSTIPREPQVNSQNHQNFNKNQAKMYPTPQYRKNEKCTPNQYQNYMTVRQNFSAPDPKEAAWNALQNKEYYAVTRMQDK